MIQGPHSFPTNLQIYKKLAKKNIFVINCRITEY